MVVSDGSRSGSDCSQGTNWCEDWGNSRNITSVGVFLIEGLAKAFVHDASHETDAKHKRPIELGNMPAELAKVWLCLKLLSLQQNARIQKMHFK